MPSPKWEPGNPDQQGHGAYSDNGTTEFPTLPTPPCPSLRPGGKRDFHALMCLENGAHSNADAQTCQSPSSFAVATPLSESRSYGFGPSAPCRSGLAAPAPHQATISFSCALQQLLEAHEREVLHARRSDCPECGCQRPRHGSEQLPPARRLVRAMTDKSLTSGKTFRFASPSRTAPKLGGDDDDEDVDPGFAAINEARRMRMTMQRLEVEKQARKSKGTPSTTESPAPRRMGKLRDMLKWRPNMEARDLDFIQLTKQQRGPSANWHAMPGKDRADIIRQAMSSNSILLDPDSDYLKAWDVVLVLALVFTAIVTPFELAFVKHEFNSFYIVNRIVDFVFVKDICLQFVLKVKKQTKQGTTWIRDRKQIAKLYLRSWFSIDVLSIVPFDDIAHLASADSMGNLTLIRMLRVCRLAKLARILKASKIVKRWENRVGIPTAQRHLWTFSVLVIIACHWMACVWGFFGMVTAGNLECRAKIARSNANDPRLAEFPGRAYWINRKEALDPWNPSNWNGESWVVAFASNRLAGTPSDPCDAWTIYTAAMYWAVMTLTSIGYGDIVPTTRSEYIICNICMLGSSVLWAYIIGAACAITANMDPEQTEFEQRLDAFNHMAKDEELPHEIRYRCREFIREERFHQHFLRNRAAVKYLGHNLRGVISHKLAGHYFRGIWFFQKSSGAFLEATAEKVVPFFYERREVIEQFGKLCVVERGAVGRRGRILVPWRYWGEDMLIRLNFLRQRIPSITLTYTEIVTLGRDDLTVVLMEFPEELRRFRRAASLLALTRVVHIYCNIVQDKKEAKLEQYEWIRQLFDTLPRNNPNAKETVVEIPKDLGECPQFGETTPPLEERIEQMQALLERQETREQMREQCGFIQQPT